MPDTQRLIELNKQLQGVLQKIHEGSINTQKLKNAESSLSTLQTKYNNLKTQLIKEEKDVEKLESFSLTNLYHSLMNDKSEKLTQENLEVLAVKAKIDSVQYEINATGTQIQSLQKSLLELKSAHDEYNALMDEKKRYIQAQMPEKWLEIEGYTNAINQLTLKQKEVKEAIAACDRVMTTVSNILSSLNSAAGWGTYDMLGGGMIATMIKRNHMTEAQNQINELNYQLNSLNKELRDVGESVDVTLDLENFLGFADWFFDGFFVDMAVQSRINEARDKMMNFRGDLERVLSQLNNEHRILTTQLKQERDKSDNLVNSL